jgi:hypothetical protein
MHFVILVSRQQEINKKLAEMGQVEQHIQLLKEEVHRAIESCPCKDDGRLHDSSRLVADFLNLIHKNVITHLSHARSSEPSEDQIEKVRDLLIKARNAKLEMMKSLGRHFPVLHLNLFDPLAG